jgi:uncharacterized membrane protein
MEKSILYLWEDLSNLNWEIPTVKLFIAREQSSSMRLIGHLHPLLVHLPIGFLLLGMLFLWLSYREKYASLGLAANISIVVGAIAALLACITGYLLSLQEKYDKAMLGRHQNLALLTTLLAMALLYVRFGKLHRGWTWLMMILLLTGIVLTGHFGSSLTHGEGYLLRSWSH